jgi:hypothetical protein
MKLRIVDLNGGTRDVRVVASDIIAYEAKFGIGIDKLALFSHMTFLAWHVEKRTKATDLEFEIWAENIEMITGVDDPKDITDSVTEVSIGE